MDRILIISLFFILLHLDYIKNYQNSIFKDYFGSRGVKMGPWHPFMWFWTR
jgi:hypothetical protein